jgi:hypothetical protein
VASVPGRGSWLINAAERTLTLAKKVATGQGSSIEIHLHPKSTYLCVYKRGLAFAGHRAPGWAAEPVVSPLTVCMCVFCALVCDGEAQVA